LVLLGFHGLDSSYGGRLTGAGVLHSTATLQGEWWRPFTAVCLHGSAGHLAANLTTGFLLLGLAMARYGCGAALLATYVAGVLGNLTGLALYDQPYRGLGASGMITAALGMISVQSLPLWRKGPMATRYVLSGVMGGVMLLALVGSDPASDLIAHAGGFVFGAILGALLAPIPHAQIARPKVERTLITILTVLLLLTWARALRGAR
jgi:rhomboid protease GluP